MATVDDVAAAILARTGVIDTWKLQKLTYYSQAWHLVWEGGRLFPERIEAWANGPVAPALYQKHRQRYSVSSWPAGDSSVLKANEIESIDAVIKFYGDKTGPQLSELTHREKPWKDARRGLASGERGNKEITKAAMLEYYSSI